MAARVPYVTRNELDAAGQAIYDRIRSDRNAPEVGLQFRALLNSPEATSYLTSMGAQLRFKSAIPEPLKEFVICVLAREWNSAIEWTAHAALATKVGVSAASLEAVRSGQGLDRLSVDEQTMRNFALELLRTKDVKDATFAAALKLLGTRGVVDLTLSCSYYTAICMAQLALKSEMEPGKVSTL
jgi:4-carboxymuconolactone decarboxylase